MKNLLLLGLLFLMGILIFSCGQNKLNKETEPIADSISLIPPNTETVDARFGKGGMESSFVQQDKRL